MANYEIKTPIVNESVEAARAAIVGIRTGSLEPRHAAIMISGARALQSAVSTDIRARLAEPKIAAQEALLIEQSREHALTDRSQTAPQSSTPTS
jgi:hypothetical protein